ncbi:phosphate ABC transporter permease PstA [Halohasta salina]|uniref:phosphate ABC transporter permease PstA n=1 Tax=Halohasta salina TaxID=2961621 RepID=UPI0020A326CE|nr:phosphate ABC transporter permease PstA [Halohasta salina]
MATETGTKFQAVSRLRGTVFEYVSLGASVFGIVLLAALLVYVSIDAFDLANASPQWLLTYFLTLVVPLIGFCLYSADDRQITRRTGLAVGGGLVVSALVFTGVEALVGPIDRLSWPLVYLFVFVVPTTGYTIFAANQETVGGVGFGLLGRLLGGTALGLAVGVLFLVFDPQLWMLAYTFGLLPAALAVGYGQWRPDSGMSSKALPIGIVGLVVAVGLRQVVPMYPTDFIIYIWSVSMPIAAGGAALVAGQRGRTAALSVGLVPLAVAVAGGFAAAGFGLPSKTVLLVLVTAGVPVAVFISRTLTDGEGTIGLVLPILLAAGVLVGALIVDFAGFPAPDPWLDPSYVTSSPSRTPVDAGLYPAIVGSVIIIALVAVLSFVLGVGTAVFLEEYTAGSGWMGALTRLIQVNIANLAAVPSVVYGLLGLGLFANFLGFGFGTAVTAAFTLSLLILPITIISAQEAIRAVPDSLRQGSYGMGATRWQTTKNVVLPEALPGIFTGTILALGRAIGETAPLIMIGAATTVFSAPDSIWSKLSAMPMQIYAWANFPQAEFRYGVVAAGVMTLLIVLLGMNATAIILRNKSEGV